MTGTEIRAGFAALLGGLLLVACNPPVDYGKPCRLTRPTLPDGGGIEFIPGGDPAIDYRFTFLANGDSDCEDLVCIRQDHKDYSALDTPKNAYGECSTPCLEDSDCGDQSLGLLCQPPAFDQEFIDQLCSTDPATCSQYFGDTSASKFCIDPNLPNYDGP